MDDFDELTVIPGAGFYHETALPYPSLCKDWMIHCLMNNFNHCRLIN